MWQLLNVPGLIHRNLQPELMDDPALDRVVHQRALAGLRRLNAWSGSVGTLWKAIKTYAIRHQLSKLRILDVACGGGDVTIGLARKSQTAPFQVELLGLDISSTAVDTARAAIPDSMANVSFQCGDALAGPLPGGFDVVISSLFLHHLSEQDATRFLSRTSAASERLLLINDLRRCAAGYWLAQAACRTFSRSKIVHVDGPRSVQGAFTIDEVRDLSKRAGLESAVVVPRWPFRLLVTWSRL